MQLTWRDAADDYGTRRMVQCSDDCYHIIVTTRGIASAQAKIQSWVGPTPRPPKKFQKTVAIRINLCQLGSYRVENTTELLANAI